MAAYKTVRTGFRMVLLLLLILVLVVGGAVWFNYLGVLNLHETIAPLLRVFGLQTVEKLKAPAEPDLLERERSQALADVYALRSEELDKREAEIKSKEAEIAQMLESLNEREKALSEQEKALNLRQNLIDDNKAKIEQNAGYLVGMPPEKAVAILEKMDDQNVVDLLRATQRLAEQAGEASIVAYWLSLMNPERAATIQRKMAIKPRSN